MFDSKLLLYNKIDNILLARLFLSFQRLVCNILKISVHYFKN